MEKHFFKYYDVHYVEQLWGKQADTILFIFCPVKLDIQSTQTKLLLFQYVVLVAASPTGKASGTPESFVVTSIPLGISSGSAFYLPLAMRSLCFMVPVSSLIIRQSLSFWLCPQVVSQSLLLGSMVYCPWTSMVLLHFLSQHPEPWL